MILTSCVGPGGRARLRRCAGTPCTAAGSISRPPNTYWRREPRFPPPTQKYLAQRPASAAPLQTSSPRNEPRKCRRKGNERPREWQFRAIGIAIEFSRPRPEAPQITDEEGLTLRRKRRDGIAAEFISGRAHAAACTVLRLDSPHARQITVLSRSGTARGRRGSRRHARGCGAALRRTAVQGGAPVPRAGRKLRQQPIEATADALEAPR